MAGGRVRAAGLLEGGRYGAAVVHLGELLEREALQLLARVRVPVPHHQREVSAAARARSSTPAPAAGADGRAGKRRTARAGSQSYGGLYLFRRAKLNPSEKS